MEDKTRLIFNIIFIVWFISTSFLMWYFYIMLKNDSAKCLYNPFIYEAKKLKEANNNAAISCSCIIATNRPIPVFYFDDKKSWWGESPQLQVPYDPNMNISSYNFSLR
jgi:hypothetical protein